jgi:hypothetical protein
MRTLQTIIAEMQQTPMFYLFSSSRELFHSNFWAWLFTLNQSETLNILGVTNIPDKKIVELKREERFSSKKVKNDEHKATADITFRSANRLEVLIENKVKDFPTKDQLERIYGACQSPNTQFIVTTLFAFAGMDYGQHWTIRTYKEIAQSIKPDSFTDTTYYRSLIEDYQRFMLLLSEFAESADLKISNEYDFSRSHKSNLFNELDKVKLSQAYLKMRSSHLVLKFNEYKKTKPELRNIEAGYSIAASSQDACLTFALKLVGEYRIGIQIEGDSLRRFVSVGSGSANIDGFAQKILNSNFNFFDVELKRKRKGKNDEEIFYTYTNFRYQNFSLTERTFNDLFDRISQEFGEIEQNKEMILSCIP